MSDQQPCPDYHEITQLSNGELAKRAKSALDTFMQSVREGGNVAENAQLYNAYQDERLKRLTARKTVIGNKGMKPSAKDC